MMFELLVEWLFSIFGKNKKAPAKRVVVVSENGYSFEDEVNYTEAGKAYVKYGSYVKFLDNPDQKEGEVRNVGPEEGSGDYRFKRWYYI